MNRAMEEEKESTHMKKKKAERREKNNCIPRWSTIHDDGCDLQIQHVETGRGVIGEIREFCNGGGRCGGSRKPNRSLRGWEEEEEEGDETTVGDSFTDVSTLTHNAEQIIGGVDRTLTNQEHVGVDTRV